jgi:hypothetical protein
MIDNLVLLKLVHSLAPRLRLRAPATPAERTTMQMVRAELIERFGPIEYETFERKTHGQPPPINKGIGREYCTTCGRDTTDDLPLGPCPGCVAQEAESEED